MNAQKLGVHIVRHLLTTSSMTLSELSALHAAHTHTQYLLSSHMLHDWLVLPHIAQWSRDG